MIPALGTQDILIYPEDSYHNVRVMHLFALLCRAGGAEGGLGGMPPRLLIYYFPKSQKQAHIIGEGE